MMLIGCLEREFLKNGLNSDVNTRLKSDLIIKNYFRKVDDLSNRITAPAPVKATVIIQNH